MNNRVKDAFDCIHAEEALKKSTKDFLQERLYKEETRRRFPYKRMAAVMACLLLVIAGWRGYSAYFTAVFTISVDVNPSIELDVNRFDEVISVEAYNEDGADIIGAVDMRFLDYREALELLFQNEDMSRYLTQDQLVEIMVCGENADRNREMLENLTACTASYGNFHCAAGDMEEVAAAHSVGLSCGKYRAFLELQALNPDITAEDVQGLSMRQIRDQITALSGDTDSTVPENGTDIEKEETGYGCGGGSGNGYGAGNGNGCQNGDEAGSGNDCQNGYGAGNGNGNHNGYGAGNGNGYHNGHGTGGGNGYRRGYGAGGRHAE